MRKRLAVAVCGFVLASLAAQTPVVSKECKLKTTLKDRFTKDTFRGTNPHLIFRKAARGGEFAFAKDGNNFLLYLIFYRDFSKRVYLDETTPMIVSLDNGDVVTVLPRGATRARRMDIPLIFNSKTVRTFYTISREDVERLSKHAVSTVEISFFKEGQPVESQAFELKKQDRKERIMRNASCILNSAP